MLSTQVVQHCQRKGLAHLLSLTTRRPGGPDISIGEGGAYLRRKGRTSSNGQRVPVIRVCRGIGGSALPEIEKDCFLTVCEHYLHFTRRKRNHQS